MTRGRWGGGQSPVDQLATYPRAFYHTANLSDARILRLVQTGWWYAR